MSNSTHRVNVVHIDEVFPHPNADTLGIIYIGGYQCVVKKENYKAGDMALYIQPDTIVPATEPFKFLWADREFSGEVPEKYRRITVRRFRKEWSEGLLMPIDEFGTQVDQDVAILYCGRTVHVGTDVADLLGFKHYEEPDQTYVLGTPGRKLTLWQKIKKFLGFSPKPFAPKNAPGVYDVESVKNYPRAIAEGIELLRWG